MQIVENLNPSSEPVASKLAELSVDHAQISLLGALSETQISHFFSHLTTASRRPGDKLFSQGDLPSCIYILLAGSVQFVVADDAVLHIDTPVEIGETLGETALVGIQPQSGSAIVVGEQHAEFLVLTRDALMNIFEQDQSLFAMLMMNLARELSRKNSGLLQRLSR